MIRYLVVKFQRPGTLTDYDILSSWDTLALARVALAVLTADGNAPGHLRYAIVGPVPRDKT